MSCRVVVDAYPQAAAQMHTFHSVPWQAEEQR